MCSALIPDPALRFADIAAAAAVESVAKLSFVLLHPVSSEMSFSFHIVFLLVLMVKSVMMQEDRSQGDWYNLEISSMRRSIDLKEFDLQPEIHFHLDVQVRRTMQSDQMMYNNTKSKVSPRLGDTISARA